MGNNLNLAWKCTCGTRLIMSAEPNYCPSCGKHGPFESFLTEENYKECKICILKRIIEGWKNYIIVNPELEVLAIERAQLCSKCLQLNFIRNEWCPECKCYIPAKIRSVYEKCPKGVW